MTIVFKPIVRIVCAVRFHGIGQKNPWRLLCFQGFLYFIKNSKKFFDFGYDTELFVVWREGYFCDRTTETEKIISALDNERNVTLIAPRRIGKTGLIHHVFSKIRQQQPDVVIVVCVVFYSSTII